ncbi:MAG: hypothetical protein M5U01_10075 [Ardenticatenaceae bacterium]|nr:hypothetical protein [Ardenticatenaceae bacterium]
MSSSFRRNHEPERQREAWVLVESRAAFDVRRRRRWAIEPPTAAAGRTWLARAAWPRVGGSGWQAPPGRSLAQIFAQGALHFLVAQGRVHSWTQGVVRGGIGGHLTAAHGARPGFGGLHQAPTDPLTAPVPVDVPGLQVPNSSVRQPGAVR